MTEKDDNVLYLDGKPDGEHRRLEWDPFHAWAVEVEYLAASENAQQHRFQAHPRRVLPVRAARWIVRQWEKDAQARLAALNDFVARLAHAEPHELHWAFVYAPFTVAGQQGECSGLCISDHALLLLCVRDDWRATALHELVHFYFPGLPERNAVVAERILLDAWEGRGEPPGGLDAAVQVLKTMDFEAQDEEREPGRPGNG